MRTGIGRRTACLLLGVATIAAGLVLRLVRIGLPVFVTKWGGSVLWAAMVYWLLAGCLPRWRRSAVAGIAVLVAWAVEASRLIHTPWLDHFRVTMAGILLLGRVFSWWHFAVYAAAIAVTAAIDGAWLRAGWRPE